MKKKQRVSNSVVAHSRLEESVSVLISIAGGVIAVAGLTAAIRQQRERSARQQYQKNINAVWDSDSIAESF